MCDMHTRIAHMCCASYCHATCSKLYQLFQMSVVFAGATMKSMWSGYMTNNADQHSKQVQRLRVCIGINVEGVTLMWEGNSDFSGVGFLSMPYCVKDFVELSVRMSPWRLAWLFLQFPTFAASVDWFVFAGKRCTRVVFRVFEAMLVLYWLPLSLVMTKVWWCWDKEHVFVIRPTKNNISPLGPFFGVAPSALICLLEVVPWWFSNYHQQLWTIGFHTPNKDWYNGQLSCPALRDFADDFWVSVHGGTSIRLANNSQKSFEWTWWSKVGKNHCGSITKEYWN